MFSLICIKYGWPWVPQESTLSHYLEVATIVCLSSFAAQNSFLLLPVSVQLCAFNGLEKHHMGENLLSLLLWYRATGLMRNASLQKVSIK